MIKNPNLLELFKKRFDSIKKIEDREIKKRSIEEKFRQLASLISLVLGLGIPLTKDKKMQMIDTNWALLKSTK